MEELEDDEDELACMVSALRVFGKGRLRPLRSIS